MLIRCTNPTVSGGEEQCQLWSNRRILQTWPLVIFFLFPKPKGLIRGTQFPDVEAMTTELWRIPEEAFRGCIKAWKKRMDKCARLEGNYFEGDKLKFQYIFGIKFL